MHQCNIVVCLLDSSALCCILDNFDGLSVLLATEAFGSQHLHLMLVARKNCYTNVRTTLIFQEESVDQRKNANKYM